MSQVSDAATRCREGHLASGGQEEEEEEDEWCCCGCCIFPVASVWRQSPCHDDGTGGVATFVHVDESTIATLCDTLRNDGR